MIQYEEDEASAIQDYEDEQVFKSVITFLNIVNCLSMFEFGISFQMEVNEFISWKVILKRAYT